MSLIDLLVKKQLILDIVQRWGWGEGRGGGVPPKFKLVRDIILIFEFGLFKVVEGGLTNNFKNILKVFQQ